MSTLPQNAAEANLEAPVALPSSNGGSLDAVIQHFINTADALAAPRPGAEELAKMAHQIAGFTRELFPGKLTIETSVDPEIRDDVSLLFQVNATGSIAEILARESRWLRTVSSLAPQWPGLFCLSIDAR